MKPLYIFANWKMYLDHAESLALAKDYVKAMKPLDGKATMAVFPSDVSLVGVQETFKKTAIAVGPQNAYWVDKGGYTGEVSAATFKSLGCQFALVGHSERRHIFNESNYEVRKKMEAILYADMTLVLCVGETLRERKDAEIEVVIEAQLRAAFDNLPWTSGKELIIAYEPVWAVSTGESCDPEEAERVGTLICKYVQGLLGGVTPIILYGGSVRPDNVANYLAQEHISGVLVGGASTKMNTWQEIVNEVAV